MLKDNYKVFFLILFVFQTNVLLKAQDINIRSLHIFAKNDPLNFPVLSFNRGKTGKLIIEFDVEAQSVPDLNLVFRFCDNNWKPYENLALQNDGYNTEYSIWLQSTPHTLGAGFHYKGSFPNKNITFPFPGKWQVYITDVQDTSQVYDWGRFIVAEKFIPLKTKIEKGRMQGEISDNNELDRIFNLSVEFNIPDSLYPANIEQIEIIENHKDEYPVLLTKERYVDHHFFEWNGTNEFKFKVDNLKPGNEYRRVNLKNKNLYSPPVTKAHFYNSIDYSRFYRKGKKDFNGGFKLVNYKNEYADYMTAIFEFKPPNPAGEDIFIVGPFTNWEVLPGYKLDLKNSVYSIGIDLKRGVYDYQYVTGVINGNKVEDIDWYIYEGNFWETENVYNILLYYRTDDLGGYDKIIGFKRILSRGL